MTNWKVARQRRRRGKGQGEVPCGCDRAAIVNHYESSFWLKRQGLLRLEPNDRRTSQRDDDHYRERTTGLRMQATCEDARRTTMRRSERLAAERLQKARRVQKTRQPSIQTAFVLPDLVKLQEQEKNDLAARRRFQRLVNRLLTNNPRMLTADAIREAISISKPNAGNWTCRSPPRHPCSLYHWVMRQKKDTTLARDQAEAPSNMPNPLPKPLPGTVCPQWVRCGRPACRCARGQLHGPYYYRFFREKGRLKKTYVRQADVEQVRAQCETRRQARCDLSSSWAVWRQLATLVREVEGT